ncbi:hypothetical protein BP6252_09901 [Coleophoma cylindrospora]|uniref:Uncharacterized protein n=1 Tax=Coleophoma cylindrospora TaxID=1849047 RepID=A0A3D8QWV4_9HELO|nr:hypothetical protein BP6252_09901 [Coleophoma cylindrospora]
MDDVDLPQNTLQSPPREPPSDQIMAEAPDSPPAEVSNSNNFVSASESSSSNQVNGGGSAAKISSGAPGATWNNKKFMEDYHRADATLVDRDWDATRYGDPLLKS